MYGYTAVTQLYACAHWMAKKMLATRCRFLWTVNHYSISYAAQQCTARKHHMHVTSRESSLLHSCPPLALFVAPPTSSLLPC